MPATFLFPFRMSNYSARGDQRQFEVEATVPLDADDQPRIVAVRIERRRGHSIVRQRDVTAKLPPAVLASILFEAPYGWMDELRARKIAARTLSTDNS